MKLSYFCQNCADKEKAKPGFAIGDVTWETLSADDKESCQICKEPAVCE